MGASVYLKPSKYDKIAPNGIEEVVAELLNNAGYTEGRFGLTIISGEVGSPSLQRNRVRVLRSIPNGIELKTQPGDNNTARRCVLESAPVEADVMFCKLAKHLTAIDTEGDEEAPPPLLGDQAYVGLKAGLSVLKAKVEAYKKAETRSLEVGYEIDGLTQEQAAISKRLEEIEESLAAHETERKEIEIILNDPSYQQAGAQFAELKKEFDL